MPLTSRVSRIFDPIIKMMVLCFVLKD